MEEPQANQTGKKITPSMGQPDMYSEYSSNKEDYSFNDEENRVTKEIAKTPIDTSGDSYISGHVNTDGGDFVGRDVDIVVDMVVGNKISISNIHVSNPVTLRIVAMASYFSISFEWLLALHTVLIRGFTSIEESSIIGLLIKQKINKDMKSYRILFSAIAVNLLLNILGVVEFNIYVLLFLVLTIGLIYISQRILAYRLAKGYYGTNEYEVREILQFILDHSDKTDFTDGDGMKKLMPDPEVTQQQVFVEGAVYQ